MPCPHCGCDQTHAHRLPRGPTLLVVNDRFDSMAALVNRIGELRPHDPEPELVLAVRAPAELRPPIFPAIPRLANNDRRRLEGKRQR